MWSFMISYSATNTIKVIKSRTVKLAWHATCAGETLCVGLWWGSAKETDHLEYVEVNERISLKLF
jgi:hypothetical protein